jgi:hypothetical protein
MGIRPRTSGVYLPPERVRLRSPWKWATRRAHLSVTSAKSSGSVELGSARGLLEASGRSALVGVAWDGGGESFDLLCFLERVLVFEKARMGWGGVRRGRSGC